MEQTDFLSALSEAKRKRKTEAILQRLAQPTEPTQPAKLYHYTNADGLVGIISTDTLWASHIRHLNDFSEVKYGATLALDVLSSAPDPSGKELAEFFRRVLQAVARLIDPSGSPAQMADAGLGRLPFWEAYVVCFCEQNDLLSQWRAYGANEGYSIEFDPQLSFDEGLSSELDERSISFSQIDYDKDSQRKRLCALLNDFESDLAAASEKVPPASAENAVEAATWFLLDTLSEWVFTVKDGAFQEEREWRLLCLPPFAKLFDLDADVPRGVKTRVFRRRVVPYVEIGLFRKGRLRSLPITQIQCGPCVFPDLSANGVRILLRNNGYKWVAVESSKIPLRE
ncbi:MAG: DUF2971 domain-containing protein [Bryobacteraceae bacterium]|jgi:hypothetical protein